MTPPQGMSAEAYSKEWHNADVIANKWLFRCDISVEQKHYAELMEAIVDAVSQSRANAYWKACCATCKECRLGLRLFPDPRYIPSCPFDGDFLHEYPDGIAVRCKATEIHKLKPFINWPPFERPNGDRYEFR